MGGASVSDVHLEALVSALIASAALLVAINLAGIAAKFMWGQSPETPWIVLFDLDRERNVPSVFSTFLIVFCSFLMGRLARAVPAWRDRWGWLGLSLIFLFLAVDELISLHERLIIPLRRTWNTSGLLYFAWVIPYGLATLMVGLLGWRFLMRLPPSLRRAMVIAGVVYVGGAMGVEVLGGAYLESRNDVRDLTYGFLTTVEETLEMAGMISLARGLVRYGPGVRQTRSGSFG